MKALLIYIFVASFLVSNSRGDAVLSLSDYLRQVREQNKGLVASSNISSGALMRSREGKLQLYPAFFTNIQTADDKKPTPSIPSLGTETKLQKYSLGVTQQTTFGLQGKISYNLIKYDIKGTNPALVREPLFWEGLTQLELTQSLWRNGFGSEVRATQELLEAQALATSFSESYRIKALLAEAEITYWRTALARATVLVQRETLARAEKIRDWSLRRTNLQLADRADLLQAEAAREARTLELQAALDEESTATRVFNTIRGQASDTLNEQLEPLEKSAIDRLTIPAREKMRDDAKAAQQAQTIAIANAKLGRERNLPNLDLFVAYSRNGRDVTSSPAVSESFGGTFPTTLVGVKFSTPLGIGTMLDVRKGYQLERDAAELNFERKLFEQDREWNDLVNKYTEGKKRLTLAANIEEAQRIKLMHERERLNRGRTTTFQVLSFEQDYATAQLTYLRAETDIIRLIAQMRTFGGAQ